MKNLELKIAIDIVLRAASVLRDLYYSQDKLEVSIKADGTPVTNADFISNKLIVNDLYQHFPDIPVLSEEEPVASFAQRRLWSRYWLLDPLDGTSQFINRTGEFSINLALIENNEPVLGVVSVPASNLVYYSIKGTKAYKQFLGHDPEEIRVRSFEESSPLIVIAGHSLNISPVVLDVLVRLNINYELTKYGSSLKICRVAEGLAHLYPRLEKNCEWDTAAGHCILNSAGGQMIDLESMDELKYNMKPSMVSQAFVACAPQLEHVINDFAVCSAQELI